MIGNYGKSKIWSLPVSRTDGAAFYQGFTSVESNHERCCWTDMNVALNISAVDAKMSIMLQAFRQHDGRGKMV